MQFLGEIALKWPLLNHIPDTKSTAYSNTRLRNKSTLTFVDNDMSYSKLSNVTSVNQIRNNPLVLNDSEFSLDQRQQNIEWNSKAQEGIVTYELPDGLPDGVALHNKLQTLMKTNTIYLNDRQFWNTLEHRFKTLRKVFYSYSVLLNYFKTPYRKVFKKIWNVYVKINKSMNKNLSPKVYYRIPLKKQFEDTEKNNDRKRKSIKLI